MNQWSKYVNQKTEIIRVDQKPHPTICCLQETHFKYKDTQRVKVKEWRKLYYANFNEQKAGVAILISDRADFRTRKVIREKGGCNITIKVSILQEDITIINMYIPDKSIKLHKAKIDRTSRRNRYIHYHSWRLQHPSITNGQMDPVGRKSVFSRNGAGTTGQLQTHTQK